MHDSSKTPRMQISTDLVTKSSLGNSTQNRNVQAPKFSAHRVLDKPVPCRAKQHRSLQQRSLSTPNSCGPLVSADTSKTSQPLTHLDLDINLASLIEL